VIRSAVEFASELKAKKTVADLSAMLSGEKVADVIKVDSKSKVALGRNGTGRFKPCKQARYRMTTNI